MADRDELPRERRDSLRVRDEEPDGEAAITLGLLDALHRNSEVSQRSLSSDLGIALGLTNAYLKRCVRKGWIKVRSVPANRYAYYLTPKGFAEKSRLTARYLTTSFSFYREARSQCDGLFERSTHLGWKRIGLYGLGDLAEIAVLCGMRYPIQIAGITDPEANVLEFLGVPVAHETRALGAVDGFLLTDFTRPQRSFARLTSEVPPERVLAPAMLRISRSGPPVELPA